MFVSVTSCLLSLNLKRDFSKNCVIALAWARVTRMCRYGVSRGALTRRSSSPPCHPETRKGPAHVTRQPLEPATHRLHSRWRVLFLYSVLWRHRTNCFAAVSEFHGTKRFRLDCFKFWRETLVWGLTHHALRPSIQISCSCADLVLSLLSLSSSVCARACVSGGPAGDGHPVRAGQQAAGQIQDAGGHRWAVIQSYIHLYMYLIILAVCKISPWL